MSGFLKALGAALWTALFAALLTVGTGAVWSGLFLANLRLRPDLPWAAAAMLAVSIALWLLIGGGARARYLRAKALAPGTFVLALLANGASIAALAGLWIVLIRIAPFAERAADYSALPRATLLASLAAAALVGGAFEEAGFRGYFQGTLEGFLPRGLAVLLCAAAMAPLHAATQGFAWQVLLFYLLVDLALGASAALTGSILPGLIAHVAGLFAFFAVIWPADGARPMIAAGGPDQWFWIHVAQFVVLGVAGVWLFARLAQIRAKAAA